MQPGADPVQRGVMQPDGIDALAPEALLRAIRVMVRARGYARWADADDLAQEVLVTTLAAIRSGELRDPARIQSYLSVLLRNVAADEYKRGRRLVSLPEEPEAGIDESDPTLAAVERQARHDSLLAAVSRLTMPRDRTLLRAFYLEGEDKDAICARLGLAPGQFDGVLHRARLRVKRMLGL
jgi:RNA polymerase sigma factor (sigma-70 family)